MTAINQEKQTTIYYYNSIIWTAIGALYQFLGMAALAMTFGFFILSYNYFFLALYCYILGSVIKRKSKYDQ